MKVRILQPFRSKRYKRVMQKGEIVDVSKGWADEVEKQGLAVPIEIEASTKDVPMPVRRVKKINKKRVETASIEPKTD